MKTNKKTYSFKPTGNKLTRYDEFTGEPYEINETILVEDPNGLFTMQVIKGPRFELRDGALARVAP